MKTHYKWWPVLVPEILASFWDAGVHRVSPGALGMQLEGKPLSDDEAFTIVRCLGADYMKWDKGWIQLLSRPEQEKIISGKP